MLRMRHVPAGPASRRPGKAAGGLLASALCTLGVVAVSGCTAAPPAVRPPITLSSAQVTEPNAAGTTDAYVDVQNNGPADKLISANISVGGVITLRSPVRDGTATMRTVQSILIPADSLVRLDPAGSHLLITAAGHMRSGTEVTLTLVFAHAGAVSVLALVTNPQTGGSSYFLN